MIEIVESNYTADGHEKFISELLDEDKGSSLLLTLLEMIKGQTQTP